MRTIGRRESPPGRRWAATLVVAAALTLAGAATASAEEVVVGGWKFDVGKATVAQEAGYQVAYSATDDAVWVTATNHDFRDGVPVAAASSISKVDPGTLAVTDTITPRTLDVGQPSERSEAAYGLAVDDEHGRVWTTSTREGTVVVYDRATGDRVATIPGIAHGRDIAIDPYADVAFVSDPTNHALYRISTDTLALTSTLPDLVPSFSPMSLDLVADEDSALLYSVNLDDGALVEMDTRNYSSRVVAATGGQRASGVAVDPDRQRAYVASQDSQDLRTVDLATGEVIGTATASGALLNAAVDREHGLVFSAVFGGSSLLVSDADTGAKLGEIPVGTSPNDVVFAKGSAWAVDRSGASDGRSQLWRVTALERTGDPGDPGDPDPPPAATASVAGTPRVGGTITLKGTGWLTTDGSEGSRIAIKLDDGVFAKPSGNVWQVIDANPDGSFEATVQLPDGTTDPTTGSTPAYAAGAHWLRLLTGSLKTGDRGRSQRIDIDVQPAASPPPGGGTTPPAAKAPTSTTAPAIAGTARYGRTLTARAGTWADAAGATYAYQWRRGGKAIAGATGPRYRVRAADVGTRLSVAVTATTAAGATTAGSAAVRARKGAARVRLSFRRSGRGAHARTAVTVRVRSGALAPQRGTVRVLVGGERVATRTLTPAKRGRVQVRLPRGAGGRATVKAVFAGDATCTRASAHQRVRVAG